MDGLPHFFVGGDIKNLNEPKVAQNAMNDGILIANNLLKIRFKQKLWERGSLWVPAIKQSMLYGISIGPHTGIVVQPIANGWTNLVFSAPFVQIMKDMLRSGIKKMITGENNLTFLEDVLVNYLNTSSPNIKRMQKKQPKSLQDTNIFQVHDIMKSNTDIF